MPLVQTIEGLIERELLEVDDAVEEGDNYRKIVTTWRYQGRIVKQDAAVAILAGLALSGEQPNIG